MFDITSTPARSLSALIRTRAISPVEVVDGFLSAIERDNGRLGAFSACYPDEARRSARAAERAIARGAPIGLLQGIPIAIKDSMDLAGEPTFAGSAQARAGVPRRSAAIVERLEQCGAIVVGKTRMAEFGIGAIGINEHFGTPRNPWAYDAHRAPGGSSSGAAVAVAARLVPWAVGTDTGGSARIPAAWCGVAGMKPTHGALDMSGVAPLSPTLDVIGPICGDVDDLAYLWHALSSDPDRSSPGTVARSAGGPLNGLRLGVLASSELAGADAQVLGAYDEAIDTFARLDVTIVRLALPQPLLTYRERTSTITFKEAYDRYGAWARDPDSRLGEAVRHRLLRAARYTVADYDAAKHERACLKREFAGVFSCVDALLTPTTQGVAPLLHESAMLDPPTHFTRFVNFLDLCAVSVPAGFAAGGLPIGVQVVSAYGRDATALMFAAAFQHNTGWHLRKPPRFAGSVPSDS